MTKNKSHSVKNLRDRQHRQFTYERAKNQVQTITACLFVIIKVTTNDQHFELKD